MPFVELQLLVFQSPIKRVWSSHLAASNASVVYTSRFQSPIKRVWSSHLKKFGLFPTEKVCFNPLLSGSGLRTPVIKLMAGILLMKFQSPIKRVWSSHEENNMYYCEECRKSFNPLLSGSGLRTRCGRVAPIDQSMFQSPIKRVWSSHDNVGPVRHTEKVEVFQSPIKRVWSSHFAGTNSRKREPLLLFQSPIKRVWSSHTIGFRHISRNWKSDFRRLFGTVQKSSDSRTLYLNLTSFSPLLQVVKPFHAGFISDFYHNPRTAHTKLHKSHKNSLFERKEKIATANEGLRHAYNF